MAVIAYGNHVSRRKDNTSEVTEVEVDGNGLFVQCLICDYKMRLQWVYSDADGSSYEVLGLDAPCKDPKTEVERSL
jgi:hypothetical protein